MTYGVNLWTQNLAASARARKARRIAGWALPIVVLASTSVVYGTGGSPTSAIDVHSRLLAPSAGWLETVNFYRTSSGLGAVTAEPAWVDGQIKHLSYMENTPGSFRTGAYANAHTENPASPWYTPEGDSAGRSSNIGGGASERGAIEGWMTAPFHSIGVMRPSLTRAAFAMSSRGAAMLDVVRGLTPPAPGTVQPTVLFPGNGSVTSLTSFAGESPDPREGCAGDWRTFRGLPMYALLPASPPPGTTARMVGPDGMVVTEGGDLCVQTGASFNSTDTIYGPTGKGILTGANAVLIIPRAPLARGSHRIVVERPGQNAVEWTFVVKPAPVVVTGMVMPEQPLRVQVGVAGGTVFGTLTVDGPLGSGYLTAYPCESGRPVASNLNFVRGQTVANSFVSKIDGDGYVCVYSEVPTHVIVDTTAETQMSGTHPPTRLVDTRNQSHMAE